MYYLFYDELGEICRSKTNMQQYECFHKEALKDIDVKYIGEYDINHLRLYQIDKDRFGVIQSANPFDYVTCQLCMIDAKDILVHQSAFKHIDITLDTYYSVDKTLYHKVVCDIECTKNNTNYMAYLYLFNIATFYRHYADTMRLVRSGNYTS